MVSGGSDLDTVNALLCPPGTTEHPPTTMPAASDIPFNRSIDEKASTLVESQAISSAEEKHSEGGLVGWCTVIGWCAAIAYV